MINGAHVIVYSNDADADRAFLRDVLGLPHVDVGGGWLIFGMPPSEVAVHPGSENDRHELSLMCEDVAQFVAAMKTRRIACTAVRDEGWGKLTEMTLPGGGAIGVYEPRHARPGTMTAKGKSAKPPARAARKGRPARKAAPARKATKARKSKRST